MLAVVTALAAGWVVLRLAGVDRRWPWRVADLSGVPMPSRRFPASRSTAGRPEARRGAGRSRTDHAGRHGTGRAGRRRLQEVTASIAPAVDLLVVAVSAGHTLRGAVSIVGRTGDDPVRRAFGEVDRAVRSGASLEEELARLDVRLGAPARSLASTLAAAERSGAPLDAQLRRLADAERLRHRRQREQSVRRLPLLLLGPLVGLVLPAFVLLSIVPVGLTTIRTSLVPAASPADPPSPDRSLR